MGERTKEQDHFHKQGFAAGTAVAAAIIVSVWGEERMAEEVVRSAGFKTRAQMKALGCEAHDLDILKPVFASISRKKRRPNK